VTKIEAGDRQLLRRAQHHELAAAVAAAVLAPRRLDLAVRERPGRADRAARSERAQRRARGRRGGVELRGHDFRRLIALRGGEPLHARRLQWQIAGVEQARREHRAASAQVQIFAFVTDDDAARAVFVRLRDRHALALPHAFAALDQAGQPLEHDARLARAERHRDHGFVALPERRARHGDDDRAPPIADADHR
jgi:hypothetical protein